MAPAADRILRRAAMAAADTLARGRDAFERKAWAEAHTLFSTADREVALGPDDRERLASAAYLLGLDEESAQAWGRAHQDYLGAGDVRRAVRCAFWLAFGLLNRGELARGRGWVARARRLLAEVPDDCVERGYLLLPAAHDCIAEGDYEGAATAFAEAGRIGGRFGEADLVALARHGEGRCSIRRGRLEEGAILLDEAMVAVDAGEVSPVVVGDVYCSVIAGCLEISDLRRAREWTMRMTRWCDAQPELVAYSGQCLVRRAEILQLHGDWPKAAEAARQASERCLQGPDQAAMGAAWYQRAELHRLRGESAEAEEAYREASRRGRSPQPGLARLRLAQGAVKAAATAIRGALEEAGERRMRSSLLPAQVEIMIAAGDLAAARLAVDELADIAAGRDEPLPRAVADEARGALLLAEGDAQGALPLLRRAWVAWQEIEAPYPAARVRVLASAAYRKLGDDDAAEMEIDAARWIFRELGAAADLARAEGSARPGEPAAPGSLSPREVEVLRLVATGRTNRAIASELFISERTVERHVSNIFAKLELPSRAAATAYAYRNKLV
jgi:ATP/maltotriose-dependent transcriptional regulator MalT